MLKNMVLFLVIAFGINYAQPPQTEGSYRHKNMDAVRIWKLTEVLELTEDQIVTFLPQIQIQERKLREAQKDLQDLNKEGRTLLANGEVSQKKVNKLVKRYTAKQDEIHEIKTKFIQSLPQYLTPEQQLLYIGFEVRFRRELREYMKGQRGKRKDGHRPGKP